MIGRPCTKQLIAESLKELMKKRSFEKITVKMIVDNCHVTRQTFYKYFQDKYDLLGWVFSTNIDRVLESNSGEQSWCKVLEEMLRYMKEEQTFYVNAVSYRGQNNLKHVILEYTRTAYARELRKRLNTEDLSQEFLASIEFNSYGAAGFIYNWIGENMSTEPKLLAQFIADNMPEKMKQYFN